MTSIQQIVLSNVLLSTGLALVVFVVTRLWKNEHVAHLLWVIVLAKLITLPLWNVPVAVVGPTSSNSEGFAVTDGAAPSGTLSIVPLLHPVVEGAVQKTFALPESQPRSSLAGWIFALVPIALGPLLLGSAVLSAVVALTRAMRFHRIARHGRKVDGVLMQRVQHLVQRLGLRGVPDVRLLDAPVSPMVWPLAWRRMLLLPQRLVHELTPAQLDTVIAHELAHIARRDELVRFLEVIVTCLFWWNPVVWLARRELHAAEEACCDALVVCALRESRHEYGEALLRCAEMIALRRSLPSLASAFGQQPVLKRRIEMILNHEFRRSASWRAKTLVLILSACVLPLAATAVSQEKPTADQSKTVTQANAEQSNRILKTLKPQWAEQEEEQKKLWERHRWLLGIHGDGQLVNQSCSSCHDFSPTMRDFFLFDD